MELPGRFFTLLSFLQPLSCYIPPVASSAVVLWGRVSVLTLWSSMTCTRTERWHLSAPGWLMLFFCCFVLFPFRWWVRTAGVFFGSGQKISEGRQMLVIFTYFWSLQVNQTERQEASGGSRLLPGELQKVVEASSSVSPRGWEGGREVPLRTLNTEGYLNGKWYYWGLARRQEFCFTIKLKFDVFLFHMGKKQKPFHC